MVEETDASIYTSHGTDRNALLISLPSAAIVIARNYVRYFCMDLHIYVDVCKHLCKHRYMYFSSEDIGIIHIMEYPKSWDTLIPFPWPPLSLISLFGSTPHSIQHFIPSFYSLKPLYYNNVHSTTREYCTIESHPDYSIRVDQFCLYYFHWIHFFLHLILHYNS